MSTVMLYHILISILLGFVLDCFIGDPESLPHPVRFIGSLISLLDKRLRSASDSFMLQRVKGFILSCIVVFVTVLVSYCILFIAYKIHFVVGIIIESIMCCQCIAARNLYDSSMRVFNSLQKKDILASRKAVSMIVGRDTDSLDEWGIERATIETVAESSNDGVIAPLFFLALGGPVLAFAYKAINTMDSMIGYKNNKYRYFGTFAAKCDDVANFIPARISALSLILSSFILHLDTKNAVRIFLRDRYKHASPNSAQTESVCAGALNVRLAGDAYYGGILEHKDFIGDNIKQVELCDIKKANKLMYLASIICLCLFCVLRFFIVKLFAKFI